MSVDSKGRKAQGRKKEKAVIEWHPKDTGCDMRCRGGSSTVGVRVTGKTSLGPYPNLLTGALWAGEECNGKYCIPFCEGHYIVPKSLGRVVK